MLISIKILIVLWAVNLAPPLLAHLLEDKWNTPVDQGRHFIDGKPILGPHKTFRGLVAAVFTGIVIGYLVGWPLSIGLAVATLSMLGDLVSSFIKRRLKRPSGTNFPLLDQIIEGSLPFLVLGAYYQMSTIHAILTIVLFSASAYAGSYFLKNILLQKPFDQYPRPVRASVRLREFRRCQVSSFPWNHVFNIKDIIYYHLFMAGFFKITGLYNIGRRNALDIRRRDLSFEFSDLPASFHNYTILFMTDLHLDGLHGLTERLVHLISHMKVDLCILGGDYRMEEYGSFSETFKHLQRLLPAVQARDGIISVLGNHDCLEMIEPLQQLGIRILLNDSYVIRRKDDRIWIVGVDDPHYYGCHDLEEAFKDVPPGGFSIFLAHSPEIYHEAAPYGARLYLCGHTHAGQIQFPGIGPISTHTKSPRFVCQGFWQYQGMQGYTSAGVGVSGVPVRFFSRGEIVHITLKRVV